MKKMILIGGGGHCHSCIDVIEASINYEVAGIIEKGGYESSQCMGYPILGNEDSLAELFEHYKLALITIGQIKNASKRSHLFNTISLLGFEFPIIISPTAYVSRHSQIGSGTIIMHMALINANVKIGENCIINSQALIEHDTTIESHCHISTSVKINGGVYIGSSTFIGSGAIIHQGILIGNNCIIGAGAIVFQNLPSGTTFINAK
jgi:sugar O-acyltransferase (sialic acid O-acetyltransferase NeuD family)